LSDQPWEPDACPRAADSDERQRLLRELTTLLETLDPTDEARVAETRELLGRLAIPSAPLPQAFYRRLAVLTRGQG
jgi:hypothetical protein